MILFSLYLIVSATLLVQSLHSARRYHFENIANPIHGYPGNAFQQSKDSSPNKKLKLNPPGVDQIKNVINKLLEEVAPLSKDQKRNAIAPRHPKQKFLHKSKPCPLEEKKGPEWNQWTDWSSCSVTCGRGRQIRWRHCIEHCEGVETEMEEKSCQLPACEGKLFGILKL